jgi:hypothetical protein
MPMQPSLLYVSEGHQPASYIRVFVLIPRTYRSTQVLHSIPTDCELIHTALEQTTTLDVLNTTVEYYRSCATFSGNSLAVPQAGYSVRRWHGHNAKGLDKKHSFPFQKQRRKQTWGQIWTKILLWQPHLLNPPKMLSVVPKLMAALNPHTAARPARGTAAARPTPSRVHGG